MILTGGICKNCGHEANQHYDSFPEHGWVIETCYKCKCDTYKDSDKK